MTRAADTSAGPRLGALAGAAREPWLWGTLISLFLASRLLRLTAFPCFIDEAFYLFLAEEVLQGIPAGFGDDTEPESEWDRCPGQSGGLPCLDIVQLVVR